MNPDVPLVPLVEMLVNVINPSLACGVLQVLCVFMCPPNGSNKRNSCFNPLVISAIHLWLNFESMSARVETSESDQCFGYVRSQHSGLAINTK